MKLLTLLWLVVCLMVGLSVSTATAGVMFLFVCEEPADCGGDGNFQFFLELDASVIKPNGGYSTGSDGGAGFVGWRASSKTGNGFVAHGDIGHIVGAEPHMGITFDSQGVASDTIAQHESLS